MEVKALERALETAKEIGGTSGYSILKIAVEAFLASQNKVYPTTKQTKPGNHDHSEFFKRMEDMIKKQNLNRCPKCGNTGAHFCPGERTYPYPTQLPYSMGTGIEYLNRQPTAICNFDTHPRRNEILKSMGIHEGHIYGGGQGIQIGNGIGASSR